MLRRISVLCCLLGVPAARGADGGVDAAPAGLRCLERHYAVKPERRADGWYGVLPDGTRVPWDDGEAKTPDQRLERPDLEDLFAERYPRSGEQRTDAGRVRVDALFKATFGATAAAVDVVPFRFFGQELRVHRRALRAFEAVRARLEKLVAVEPGWRRFVEDAGGTFSWRNVAGTERPSAHSYGVSIDLSVKHAHYWRWDEVPNFRNRYPLPLVEAFEAEGFIWGGRWIHYDTMHFELRPELLDERCYGDRPRGAGAQWRFTPSR